MKTNRRKFFQIAGLAGTGLMAGGMSSCSQSGADTRAINLESIRRAAESLRNGIPLDQDVYDAALWSVIAPLSEWSVANRSNSIDVPDFTNGAWKTNLPVDIDRIGA